MADDVLLREQLSSLRGLLAISLLMMERRQESEILHLATSAVPALARCRALGVHLIGAGWQAGTSLTGEPARRRVTAQLGDGGHGGGPVTATGAPWSWAFPLRSHDELVGHLVVAGDAEPPPADQLLLRSLAQQTGIAIASARLHAGRDATNAALARTIATLERKTAIHDRFTKVALDGGGHRGIAQALHELTGLPAGIEDSAGNLLAWAGPGNRPGRVSTGSHEGLAELALRAGRPIRAGDRLVTAAAPQPDVVGLLFVVDPEGSAGEAETVALEHGATVLAIELARLFSLAENELRLGVDLVADLLGGADAESAHRRARALGHDLARPHRVLVITDAGATRDTDRLILAVHEATRSARPRPLLMQRANAVVLLAPAGAAGPGTAGATGPVADGAFWDQLAARLRALPGGRVCRIGVGGMCRSADDYARSYREAQLALRLIESSARRDLALYEDLGVYQLLSETTDPKAIDGFVRRWLGPLLDYDERRGSNLVATLRAHLDAGGNYDATATALAVGRSTVRYRLSRIRELSGHDLTDPDTRFQLQLAARAWLTLAAMTGAPA